MHTKRTEGPGCKRARPYDSWSPTDPLSLSPPSDASRYRGPQTPHWHHPPSSAGFLQHAPQTGIPTRHGSKGERKAAPAPPPPRAKLPAAGESCGRPHPAKGMSKKAATAGRKGDALSRGFHTATATATTADAGGGDGGDDVADHHQQQQEAHHCPATTAAGGAPPRDLAGLSVRQYQGLSGSAGLPDPARSPLLYATLSELPHAPSAVAFPARSAALPPAVVPRQEGMAAGVLLAALSAQATSSAGAPPASGAFFPATALRGGCLSKCLQPRERSSEYHSSVERNSEYHSSVERSSEYQPSVERGSEYQPLVERSSECQSSVERNSEYWPSVERNSEYQSSVERNSQYQPSVERSSEYQPSVERNSELHPSTERNSEFHPSIERNSKFHSSTERSSEFHPSMERNSESHPSTKRNSEYQPSMERNGEVLTATEERSTAYKPPTERRNSQYGEYQAPTEWRNSQYGEYQAPTERNSVNQLSREESGEYLLPTEKSSEYPSHTEGNRKYQRPMERNRDNQQPVERNSEYPQPIERNKEYPQPIERNKEYPQPIERNKEYPQPIESNRDYQLPTERNRDYQPPIEMNKEYPQPIERNKEYLQPIERNRDYQLLTERNRDYQPPIERNKNYQQPRERNNEYQQPIEKNRDYQPPPENVVACVFTPGFFVGSNGAPVAVMQPVWLQAVPARFSPGKAATAAVPKTHPQRELSPPTEMKDVTTASGQQQEAGSSLGSVEVNLRSHDIEPYFSAVTPVQSLLLKAEAIGNVSPIITAAAKDGFCYSAASLMSEPKLTEEEPFDSVLRELFPNKRRNCRTDVEQADHTTPKYLSPGAATRHVTSCQAVALGVTSPHTAASKVSPGLAEERVDQGAARDDTHSRTGAVEDVAVQSNKQPATCLCPKEGTQQLPLTTVETKESPSSSAAATRSCWPSPNAPSDPNSGKVLEADKKEREVTFPAHVRHDVMPMSPNHSPGRPQKRGEPLGPLDSFPASGERNPAVFGVVVDASVESVADEVGVRPESSSEVALNGADVAGSTRHSVRDAGQKSVQEVEPRGGNSSSTGSTGTTTETGFLAAKESGHLDSNITSETDAPTARENGHQDSNVMSKTGVPTAKESGHLGSYIMSEMDVPTAREIRHQDSNITSKTGVPTATESGHLDSNIMSEMDVPTARESGHSDSSVSSKTRGSAAGDRESGHLDSSVTSETREDPTARESRDVDNSATSETGDPTTRESRDLDDSVTGSEGDSRGTRHQDSTTAGSQGDKAPEQRNNRVSEDRNGSISDHPDSNAIEKLDGSIAKCQGSILDNSGQPDCDIIENGIRNSANTCCLRRQDICSSGQQDCSVTEHPISISAELPDLCRQSVSSSGQQDCSMTEHRTSKGLRYQDSSIAGQQDVNSVADNQSTTVTKQQVGTSPGQTGSGVSSKRQDSEHTEQRDRSVPDRQYGSGQTESRVCSEHEEVDSREQRDRPVPERQDGSRQVKSGAAYSSKWISAVAACISAHESLHFPFYVLPDSMSAVLASVNRYATTALSTNPLLTAAGTSVDSVRSPLNDLTNRKFRGDNSSSGAADSAATKNRRCPARKKEKAPAADFASGSGNEAATPSSRHGHQGAGTQLSYCRDARHDALLFYSACARGEGTAGEFSAEGSKKETDSSRKPGHKCPECSLEFATLTDLHFHVSVHQMSNSGGGGGGGGGGRGSYAEGNRYSTEAGGNQGESGLSGETRNKCGVCSRVFTRSWLLKGHMRTHTGERPFRCTWPQCQRAFADKSNLRSHTLIHTTTAKSFSCPKCSRAFSQKRYLHKHMLEVCRII